MTKECIEIIRQSLIPFVKKELLDINYEGLGKSDAEEFEKDLNEILDLAIKALEQETVSKETYEREHFARKEAEYKLWDLKRNCIEIPKDASNGSMIKAMFPFSMTNLNLIEHSVCLKTNDGNKSYHNFNWWNAPYKRGSENEICN